MPQPDSDWGQLFTQLLPLAQTVIAAFLGYISKLLRDMRTELSVLDNRLGKAEVMHSAQMKLVETVVHDLRREQDAILRRLERLEERHAKA